MINYLCFVLCREGMYVVCASNNRVNKKHTRQTANSGATRGTGESESREGEETNNDQPLVITAERGPSELSQIHGVQASKGRRKARGVLP